MNPFYFDFVNHNVMNDPQRIFFKPIAQKSSYISAITNMYNQVMQDNSRGFHTSIITSSIITNRPINFIYIGSDNDVNGSPVDYWIGKDGLYDVVVTTSNNNVYNEYVISNIKELLEIEGLHGDLWTFVSTLSNLIFDISSKFSGEDSEHIAIKLTLKDLGIANSDSIAEPEKEIPDKLLKRDQRREKQREYMREYYRKNKEKILSSMKEKYENTKFSKSKVSKKDQQKEQQKEYQKEYYAKHREKYRQYSKNYYLKHKNNGEKGEKAQSENSDRTNMVNAEQEHL